MSNSKLLQGVPGFGMGSPNIQAWLSVEGMGGAVNIFPYITGISIQKDMTQPAGMFDIRLAYAPDQTIDQRLHPPGRNPLFAIDRLLDNDRGVKPFDHLELAIRDAPGQPAYYLNGFVDNITFTENAGSGGQFQRSLDLTGRDYGSLLQNYQISYMSPALLTAGLGRQGLYLALADSFAGINYNASQDPNALNTVLKNFNISQGGMNSTADFVYFVVQQGVNVNHVKGIKSTYNANVKYITHRRQVPANLGTFTGSPDLMGYEGSLDDLIRQVQSPPWAEYFIRDEGPPVNGPVLYYRIAPYLDRYGYYAWVNPDAPATFDYHNEIQYIGIPTEDVISTSISRSQNEIYTAFLTTANNMFFSDATSFLTVGLSKWKGLGNPYNDAFSPQADIRSRMDKFGYRLYQANTPWLIGMQDPKSKAYSSPARNTDDPNAPDNNFPPVSLDAFNQIQRLNLWLVATMGRMEDLYSGTITCRGIHGVRVGDYIYYQRKPTEAGIYFYVQGIAIDWSEGSPVTETISVIRGQYLAHTDTHQRPVPPPPLQTRGRILME